MAASKSDMKMSGWVPLPMSALLTCPQATYPNPTFLRMHLALQECRGIGLLSEWASSKRLVRESSDGYAK